MNDVGIRPICLFFNVLLDGILSVVFGDILYTVLCVQRTKWDKIRNSAMYRESARPRIKQEIYLRSRAMSCLQLLWEPHNLVVIATILKGNNTICFFRGQSEWQVCMWMLERRVRDVSAVVGNRWTSLHVLFNSAFGQSWKNVHFQVPFFWSHI